MSVDIDGRNGFESVSTPRARKEHTCCACAETIRRGDQYERIAFKWDGEFKCLVRCLRCSAIAKACHKRLGHEEGVAYRLDCGHEWSEQFEEEPPPEVARLAFMTADEAQAVLNPGGTDGE